MFDLNTAPAADLEPQLHPRPPARPSSDRVNLEHLDLICEALDCDLSEIIVRTPNSEVRIRSRTGQPLHIKPKR